MATTKKTTTTRKPAAAAKSTARRNPVRAKKATAQTRAATTRKRTAMPTKKRETKSGEALLLRNLDRAKKIKVLAEENPRREGTVPFDHWKKYVKDGTTLEQFFEKGGDWLHLRADIERGHVKLV